MERLKKIPRPYLYLVAVCLAALVVFWLERPAGERQGDRLNLPLVENWDTASVARIEIEHLLDGVQLEKKEGKWEAAPLKTALKKRLEEEEQKKNPKSKAQNEVVWRPADAEKIDLSLSILGEVFLTSLAGANPERHGFFEVNAAGMQVRFFDAAGKKLAHLYIGKAGPAFTESYVRREGAEKVYLADRYLRGTFSVAPEDWRRKEETVEETKGGKAAGTPKPSGSK